MTFRAADMEENKQGWFQFSTRDLVVMGFLVAASGVFTTIWAHLVFQVGILGPVAGLFTSLGFFVWGFVTVYLVRVPGAATVVKTLGAFVELMLGSPFGLLAVVLGALNGLAVDISWLIFRRRISPNMTIVGCLLAMVLTSPVDIYSNAIPVTWVAIATYYTPVATGRVLAGWLIYLVIAALARANIGAHADHG